MAKATVSLAGRDILDLESFSVEEINLVLQTAAEMKKIMKRDIKKVPSLRGKSIINLFYEPSTRTRTSFELAGKYLGADVVNITTSTSSVVKGECLRDTILTVQSMCCDAIVMRHPIEGAAVYAADVAKPVIINAGDGAHAHPSQGLLDMFTLREKGLKDLKGKKMVILGDILYSRVARTNIAAWNKMGADGRSHRRRGCHRRAADPAGTTEERSVPVTPGVRPHLRSERSAVEAGETGLRGTASRSYEPGPGNFLGRRLLRPGGDPRRSAERCGRSYGAVIPDTDWR